MEKERIRGCRSAHCLALAYQIQGHLNPLLQFCKRLDARGVKVTLATTHFILKTSSMGELVSGVEVEGISDGYDEGGPAQAESLEAYFSRLQQVGSRTLGELVQKLAHSGRPVDCIVYDSFIPWGLEVAKSFGLPGAAFFTQSCAADSIGYHVHSQLLKLPLTDSSQILLPGLPPLHPSDLPSFIYNPGSFPALYDLLVNQFSNIGEADWVLCNTFHELEPEVVDWMMKLWRFRTVGPTIPSMYLDKRVEDDRVYGMSVFKASGACMEWLDEKADGSVVYVSFGSLAKPGMEQMEELRWGLRGSEKHFVWVVKAEEEANLPKGFLDQETGDQKGKGLVVTWCSQLEVLAHRAVACFVTHSGWNSTLEALSLGVPMVSMPQWSDQTTNAKYVSDVWGIGIKAEGDEKGIVRRAEVERCIREVMDGERGKEMRRNAAKWKDVAKGAMAEGGSSDRNIHNFVTELLHSKTTRHS